MRRRYIRGPQPGKPYVSLIAAVAANGVIGNDGALPWHLPDDLARFRRVTRGKPCIMGRKTYEGLPDAFRPLPDRVNIVLTRNRDWCPAEEGVTVVHTVGQALAAAGDAMPMAEKTHYLEVQPTQFPSHNREVMVIGGAEVYALFLPYAARLYLTRVEVDVAGDARFPLDMAQLRGHGWRLVQEEKGTGEPPHAFFVYMRD